MAIWIYLPEISAQSVHVFQSDTCDLEAEDVDRGTGEGMDTKGN